jgi:hypothetical protein
VPGDWMRRTRPWSRRSAGREAFPSGKGRRSSGRGLARKWARAPQLLACASAVYPKRSGSTVESAAWHGREGTADYRWDDDLPGAPQVVPARLLTQDGNGRRTSL